MADESNAAREKAKRRAAREAVDAYHREQLRILLEHVRDGFAQLDAGEMDEFDLDGLIHRYKRATKQLWLFCGTTNAAKLRAAGALEHWRATGEGRDWWAESERARPER